MRGDRGQMAVIVIVAFAIIAAIVLFFFIRSDERVKGVPPELSPVYDYYAACIEQEAKAAVDLAGTQGGRIESEYVPGSDYAPFSSQLGFLGFGVPYWMSISGNGIVQENVPTKQGIEKEMGEFIADRLKDCDFESFAVQGVQVKRGDPKVSVSIQSRSIQIEVDADIGASKGDSSARKTQHKVEISSGFGELFNSAVEIYSRQKEDAFLEKYAEDVLRLYAPVDGVEISCTPKIWKVQEVESEIKNALELNIASLKTRKDKDSDYFYTNAGTSIPAIFRYSQDWPTKIEISGTQGSLMIAQPVGNSQGMGAMGFCYAPYHFVYDVRFPVMVQLVRDDGEIFQFPVVVVIDKNLPRQGLGARIAENVDKTNACAFPTQDIEVDIFDVQLRKIDANISYQCFEQECSIGQSKNGTLKAKAPACLNGQIIARAEGYAEKKVLFSSSKESKAELVIDKEYEVGLSLTVDRKPLSGQALVTFEGPKSIGVSLPNSEKVELSEGAYNVSVYIYGNSSIVLPATTKRECTKVTSGGILGFFGSTKEECFDITVPSTKIESAIVGGGASEVYLLPDMLGNGTLKIDVKGFSKPNSLEQLQNNYELFANSGVDIQ